MRRVGFTLIETVLSVALAAIVIGVLATLYGFATVHLADAYKRSSMSDQANSVADRIESTIRSAKSCALDSSGNLMCTMPMSGADTDGDGHLDAYYPDGTNSIGGEAYTAGNAVWFYNAGPTGSYGTGSGNVWRAEVVGGGSPTGSSLDSSFAYYYGGNLRYPLVFSVSFSVTPATHAVTYTVVSTIATTNDSGVAIASPTWTVSVTRTVTWRNFR